MAYSLSFSPRLSLDPLNLFFHSLPPSPTNEKTNELTNPQQTERAFRCSVCRTPFTLQPPRQRGRAIARILAGPVARGFAAAACVAVLALGAAGGPPWPHLALAALLLLGTRSHAALAGGALIAAVSLGTMHSRGMR